MKKILITNDDGIRAEGITVLAQALRTLKDVRVVVVAPDRERSTTSHSLTLHRPLRIRPIAEDIYSVDGNPIDAVFLGVSAILKEKPDFLFSGINRGGNLGDDIHYSGTVSAAVEGGIMGIPSVAISQVATEQFDYTMAARMAVKVYALINEHPLPKGMILNVNVPENAANLDFAVVKTGKRDYGKLCEEKHDPRGRPYYWIGGSQYTLVDIPDSDCNAIVAGKTAITPLNINMTSFPFMEEMRTWNP